MYHTILFDLDGTLTDSQPSILKALEETFSEMGQPSPSREVLSAFIGPPIQTSLQKYFSSAEALDRAVSIFQQNSERFCLAYNSAVPGMLDALKILKGSGRRLALASSKRESRCVRICDYFGFSPYFETLSGSLPDRDLEKEPVIREALRRLGLSGPDLSGILMVGDRRFDAEGAAICGIDCLGVNFFQYGDPNELERAGATAVFGTVPEMLEWILSH